MKDLKAAEDKLARCEHMTEQLETLLHELARHQEPYPATAELMTLGEVLLTLLEEFVLPSTTDDVAYLRGG